MTTALDAFDRNTNLIVIRQITMLERNTLDNYIENVLIPLRDQNSVFCDVLYKDITYLLGDADSREEKDLVFENGDLAIENGDFKLSGPRTPLVDITIWLHMEFIERIIREAKEPGGIEQLVEQKDKEFLHHINFTIEYKAELDKLKNSIRRNREFQSGKKPTLSRFLNPDLLELKPNIMGIGINVNEIINKLLGK